MSVISEIIKVFKNNNNMWMTSNEVYHHIDKSNFSKDKTITQLKNEISRDLSERHADSFEEDSSGRPKKYRILITESEKKNEYRNLSVRDTEESDSHIIQKEIAFDLENQSRLINKSYEKKAKKLLGKELEERAIESQSAQAIVRTTTTRTYQRNTFVTEFAKRRAKGICQLCNKPAPFNNKEGEPYLETHHIKWLSRGGSDTIDNTVALCPNCHKKIHVLDMKSDVKILREKIKGKK